jgi:hypothetical protein
MLRLYWPRLSILPTAGYVLSAHAHNLAQYAGKDRQLSTGAAALSRSDGCRCRCNVRAGYVLYELLLWYCSVSSRTEFTNKGGSKVKSLSLNIIMEYTLAMRGFCRLTCESCNVYLYSRCVCTINEPLLLQALLCVHVLCTPL